MEKFNKRKIVLKILKTLEIKHINLYHNVSKKTVLDYIDSMNYDMPFDRILFDYEMLRLFHLFQDEHTSYNIKNIKINAKLYYIQNVVYLKDEKEFYEVTKIGNLQTEDFIKKISELQCYTTKAYLDDRIRRAINNAYYYQMLNIMQKDKIPLKIMKNGKIEQKCLEVLNNKKDINTDNIKNIPLYEFKIIDEEILYVIYRMCANIKGYAFKQFVRDIKKELKNKNINKFILDIRDNHGGNSEILNPFQKLVKQKKMKGVILIDNGVFSSGIFAVARFKKEFNTYLIGEETGGNIKHYGMIKRLKVDNFKFSVSTKLWDFTDIFGYEGSIKPDKLLIRTMNDVMNKNDIHLNYAIKYLKKEVY